MISGEIIRNARLKGDYFKIDFYAPEITAGARSGQFVHVRIDHRADRILRRPFSIFNATENGILSVVYKVVGEGTRALSQLRPGGVCEIMGPLGRGFSPPPSGTTPVAVDGGYGAAATFMLTRECTRRGLLLLGARSSADILLTEEYAAAGFEVRLATNDGSAGTRGLVTDLVTELLDSRPDERFYFYSCGPHPMLMALARLLRRRGLDGQLSIDHYMCCGIGACFGCVVKVNDPESESGWRYARSCSEGPVFDLNQVYVE